MTKQDLVDVFADAVARYEGFFLKKSLAKRNNNPGNMRSWGKTKVVGGFAVFDTPEEGWAALKQQISKNVFVRGLTFREFFGGKEGVYGGYAPDDDGNDSVRYASFVASRLGAKNVDQVIEDILNAEEKDS